MKGPLYLGANLGLAINSLRFLASNQTLSSLAKGVNPQLLCEVMTWQVSLWMARTSSRVVMRDFRWDSTMRMEELEIREGRT